MLDSERRGTYSNFGKNVRASLLSLHPSPLSNRSLSLKGYSKQTSEKQYLHIRYRNMTGCFKVSVVHTAVLINMWAPKARGLSYLPLPKKYRKTIDDDMVHFAYLTKNEGNCEMGCT